MARLIVESEVVAPPCRSFAGSLLSHSVLHQARPIGLINLPWSCPSQTQPCLREEVARKLELLVDEEDERVLRAGFCDC